MHPDQSTVATSTAEPPLDVATAKRNRLVILLLLVSSFVVILNETIMGVAIPHLMTDLSISASTAQWLTTAFMLTMAVVIPITGYLLQRLATRPVFILAMSTFCLGTLVSAVAPGLPVLIVGRIIQAIGTAIMMPLLMTTVMTLVPPESRGKTMGNISIVISVAPAIGPTLSGIILNHLTWRWMFWLVLPIALGALVLGAIRISNVSTTQDAPLDLPSVPLAALGFGGLVYGLNQLGDIASASGPIPGWMPLALGSAALVAFIWRQLSLQRNERALLDLRTLTSANFTLAVVSLAIGMMSLFGTFLLLPIYMQFVLGLDPLSTGLLLLPGGLIMGLMAPSVGRLYDRHGPKGLTLAGTGITSAVLWFMTTMHAQTPVAALLIAHVVLSVGLALTFTPLFTAGLGSLPPRLYSHGSAMVGTVQQLAGAAGAALFVALMSLQTAKLLSQGLAQVDATAGGIRLGFLCGALISLVAIVAVYFVKKPADDHPAH